MTLGLVSARWVCSLLPSSVPDLDSPKLVSSASGEVLFKVRLLLRMSDKYWSRNLTSWCGGGIALGPSRQKPLFLALVSLSSCLTVTDVVKETVLIILINIAVVGFFSKCVDCPALTCMYAAHQKRLIYMEPLRVKYEINKCYEIK